MRKTTIPLYHGDDFEQLGELRRAIEIAERKAEAEQNAPRRAGDDLPAAENLAAARANFSAFVDEATERAEMWVLQPIGHEEFRNLLRDHPPRKITEPDGEGGEREVTHPEDAELAPLINVNTETFPKALLGFVDAEDDEIRTIAEPVFDSPAAMRKRLRRLAAGEFESLWVSAYMINDGTIGDPKASPYYSGAPKPDVT